MSQEELSEFYDAKEKAARLHKKKIDRIVDDLLKGIVDEIRKSPYYNGIARRTCCKPMITPNTWDTSNNNYHPTDYEIAKALGIALKKKFVGNIDVECEYKNLERNNTHYIIHYDLKKREQKTQTDTENTENGEIIKINTKMNDMILS